ncbi:MAG: hypothetical protein WD944_01050 [Steroidobacteraceae bacterium]
MGRDFRRLASLALIAWITSGATAWAADATLHLWRIEITGGADSHGEIVFSFFEDGVEITQIPAAIPRGTPENAVARRIRKEMRRMLPKEQYGIELKSGEKVLISAQGHTKDFEFRLVRNTVQGTTVSIARE